MRAARRKTLLNPVLAGFQEVEIGGEREREREIAIDVNYDVASFFKIGLRLYVVPKQTNKN